MTVDQLARAPKPGARVSEFLDSLPHILAAQDLREVIDHVVTATKEQKMVIAGMGAHVITVGLSPIIIQLMEAGVIKGIALNGAGVIHDVELALEGKTLRWKKGSTKGSSAWRKKPPPSSTRE